PEDGVEFSLQNDEQDADGDERRRAHASPFSDRAGLAVVVTAHEDQDLFEAREVDDGLRFDRLIDAEVALDDLRDFSDGQAFRKTATEAARHQHIALVDGVGALHILDAHEIALVVAGAAHEATRTRAFYDDVGTEPAVHRQLHLYTLAGHSEHLAHD